MHGICLLRKLACHKLREASVSPDTSRSYMRCRIKWILCPDSCCLPWYSAIVNVHTAISLQYQRRWIPEERYHDDTMQRSNQHHLSCSTHRDLKRPSIRLNRSYYLMTFLSKAISQWARRRCTSSGGNGGKKRRLSLRSLVDGWCLWRSPRVLIENRLCWKLPSKAMYAILGGGEDPKHAGQSRESGTISCVISSEDQLFNASSGEMVLDESGRLDWRADIVFSMPTCTCAWTSSHAE